MTNCEFLRYKANSCHSCAGWFCIAGGSEKKLLNPLSCRDATEWIECPRYLAQNPEPVVVNETVPSTAQTKPKEDEFFKLVRPPSLDVYNLPCPYQDKGLCYAGDPPGVIYYFRTCNRTRQWINCKSYLKALEERRIPPLKE